MAARNDDETLVVDDGWEAGTSAPLVSYAEMEEGAATPPGRPASRGSFVLPLLALAALVVAGLAGWLLWQAGRDGGQAAVAGGARAVPSVVGLEIDAAVDRLHDVGFATEVRRRRAAGPEGTVVRQEPAGGAEAALGATVVVVASAGPPRTAVPDVAGLGLQEAADRLADAELDVRSTGVFSERPEGQVVGQRPAAGARVEPGATVVLRVSKGPRPVDVPDVVGLGAAAAVSALGRAGLESRTVEVPGDEPAGTVVAQHPAAGARAARGDAVRVNVSAGPPPEEPAPAPAAGARVPDLLGLPLADAEQALAGVGLVAVVEEAAVAAPEEDGVVLAQRPRPGERAEDREVVLLVGRWEE